jgi:hypothetical protein
MILASTNATALGKSHDAGVMAGDIAAPAADPSLVYQGSGMTLEQAVAQVRRQYQGRIVSAETRVSGGQETHIIKVLTSDGKVKTVRIPGRRL